MSKATTQEAQPTISNRRLPDGWRWVRLGDVCELIRDNVNPQNNKDETFAHYSIPAFDVGGTPTIELGAEILSNKTLIPKGTVLFSKLNPRISRVWYVNDDSHNRRICSTEFIPLASNKRAITPEYLTWLLQEPNTIANLRAQVSSSTGSRERLSPSDVLDAKIPLPPLHEQQRIAARLSEQMATVDGARAVVMEQLADANKLPAAYLRQVFEGEETQAWPRVRLGDVVDIVSGIALDGKTKKDTARMVSYLRAANVKDGYLNLSDVKQILANLDEIAKLRLKAGDIILTAGGDPDKLGRGTFWEEQLPECIHQNHIFRIRLDSSKYLPHFVSAQIASPYGKAYFFAHAKQTTGMASINQQILGGFPLIVPDIDIQREIVERHNNKMQSVTELHSRLKDELEEINRLPAMLLQRAFNGEL